MNNNDAQIAREWAEKISTQEKTTFSVDDETLAVARHILATTAPEHPAVLITEEDYDNAPEGTIAADDDGAAVKVSDGTWKWTGSELSYRSDDLCYGESDPMIVVRWGK